MAYFPNSTAGEIYEHHVCSLCQHYDEGMCPLLSLHMLYNYDQLAAEEPGPTLKVVLDVLIPARDGKNLLCSMIAASEGKENEVDALREAVERSEGT